MGIPGFTADCSLFGASQHVWAVNQRRGADPVGGAFPALAPDIHHACFNLCRGGEAYPGCMEECMAALGGDGGGGGGGGGTDFVNFAQCAAFCNHDQTCMGLFC